MTVEERLAEIELEIKGSKWTIPKNVTNNAWYLLALVKRYREVLEYYKKQDHIDVCEKTMGCHCETFPANETLFFDPSKEQGGG